MAQEGEVSEMAITQVRAEDLTPGMNVRMWYGTHRIMRIDPYHGPFEDDGCIGLVNFAAGVVGTSIWRGRLYDVEVPDETS